MTTATALRVQKHYRRRQQGRCVLSVEVDEAALVEELIVSQFLLPSDADSRTAVAKALERAVALMIERGGR
jgi:hypothetical protein